MSQHQPESRTSLLAQIEVLLQRLSLAPDDLELHRELRSISLRYASNGGRPASTFEQVRRLNNSIARLLHAERLWAMDPNKRAHVEEMLASIRAAQADNDTRNFQSIRRWLYGIIESGDAEK